MEKPVVFKNNRGRQLMGVLHIPEKKGRGFPVVVICHGFGGNKTQSKFIGLARGLASKGIAAFRFDFEGSGDSEGEFEKLTIKQETKDLTSALGFLKSQRFINTKRIGLLGHSLGAVVVTLVGLSRPGIKALMLLAPAFNQKKLIRGWYTPYEIRKWKRQGYLDDEEEKCRIGIQYFNEAENKDYTTEALNLKIPTLIIQGAKDDIVGSKEIQSFFRKLTCVKKLKLIKRARHDFEERPVRNEITRTVLQWFIKFL